MENASRFYNALVALLISSQEWADLRHLYTKRVDGNWTNSGGQR